MNQEMFLILCGFFNLILGVFHLFFWKIFKWKSTLNKDTQPNRVAIQIMNIQLIYLFLFMAFVYIFKLDALLNTNLGKILLIGYAGFWIVRFFQQFIFLKQKGTFVISLTLLFFVGAVLHLIPVLL